MNILMRMTQAVPVSRDTPEPVLSGSPPDDALGESRPVKPDADDTLGDGSAVTAPQDTYAPREGAPRLSPWEGVLKSTRLIGFPLCGKPRRLRG
jgi:hypothetical protein